MNLIGLFTALEHPDVWEPGADNRKLNVQVKTQFSLENIVGVRKTEDGKKILIETKPVDENPNEDELRRQFAEYLAEAEEHEDPDVLLTTTERVKDFALYVYMTEDSQFSQLLALWTEFDGTGDLSKFAQFVANKSTEQLADTDDEEILHDAQLVEDIDGIDDGPRHWLGKE